MIAYSRVLIVYNTDVAMSERVADYYIAARGLNAAHKLGFAMGTASTWNITWANFCTTFRDVVGQYIIDHAIDAVVLSAATPWGVVNAAATEDNPAISTTLSISAQCGLSAAFIGSPANYYDNVGYSSTLLTVGTTLARIQGPDSMDYKHHIGYIPHGRLGYGVNPLTSEDEALATRCIDDALYGESLRDYSALPVHLGYHDRAGGDFISAWHVKLASDELAARGVQEHKYVRSYSASYPVAAPTSEYDATAAAAGTITPAMDCWASIGSALGNAGEAWTGSYNFLRGAWAFESTSSFNAKYAILHGACAATGTPTEPLEYGNPNIHYFACWLAAGYSMCEATLLGGAYHTARETTWGDPLYRPFAVVTPANTLFGA